MKRIFTVITLIVFGVFNFQQTKAQEFENIVTSGTGDANTYLKNYMNPFAASLGNGLANGWYNTAKPHKTLGFDLTLNMNFAIIPDAASQFDFNADTYNNVRLANPNGDSMLPTFTGGATDTRLEIFGQREIDGEPYSFEQEIVAPDGFGLSDLPGPLAVPTPTVQLGVGIVKNTDLIIRYTPEINVDGLSFQSFGFGVKHDFKQWIPGMKLLPFDLSGLVGFNKISTNYQIDEAAGQFAEFNASATTIQAIISKKLLFFTPYAGVGVNIVKSNFAMKGDYVFNENTNEEVTVSNPIDIDFDGSGGPRFTVGARLKILWVLALNVDYTIQKYNTLSVGLGLNIR
ncbi:hypothetical protein MATR_24690 [Marivirga tractuosa]|uniref:Uncharacterized protein n=1 Tax=Marivirga tractuosa (strain ATCC 23168 / DSM 4126 / NBRC 15989 / NCIMB 1408 / VKM B-1430 / H-43) TaxID=643867 RepID=E4TQI2_MARTH|nr:DUF6588 family protein [Marivirga tractuosa]ADR23675.1 hypothetical protein Ftrac_3708 [Marivirga tractuosa DSM 4126]BDD15644.1 hypothetical protein MATR_24690 [Marivirga tractuosa]